MQLIGYSRSRFHRYAKQILLRAWQVRKILLLLLFLFPLAANADMACKGLINSVGISKHGILLVSGPGGLNSVYLCKIGHNENNVTAEACSVYYSTLLAAKAANREVNISFLPVPTHGCSSFESWRYAQNVNWIIQY